MLLKLSSANHAPSWPRANSRVRACVCVVRVWKSYAIELCHYDDVIMGAMASQITSLTINYSTVYSVNSPHKWPATRKMLPFHDVIMLSCDVQTFVGISYCSVQEEN